MLSIILFTVSIIVLALGARMLVSGAERISTVYKISLYAVGATVAAFSTSAPELLVSIFAAIAEQEDIVFGNVVGSNIINILAIYALILLYGKSAMNTRGEQRRSLFYVGFLLLVTAGAVLCMQPLFSSTGRISRIEGAFLLLLFFIGISRMSKKNMKEAVPVELKDAAKEEKNTPKELRKIVVKSVLFIVVGAVLLPVGARVFLYSAVVIGKDLLGIDERIIGLVIAATGTSLPEFAAVLTALFRGSGKLAEGTILGSNIFNTTVVLGVSALLQPIRILYEASTEILIMCAVTVLCMVVIVWVKTQRGRRILGGSFLLLLFVIAGKLFLT